MPVWRGSNDVTPGKRKWKLGDRASTIVEYSGPVTDLLTGAPDRGDEISGIAGRVVDVEVEELDAGAGKMLVTCEQIQAEATYDTPLGDPQYEIDFQEVRRPIELHPDCGVLTDAALAAKKTWENWEDLTEDDYTDDPSATSPWTLATYLGKKKAGINDYVVYAPIVRRVLLYNAKPDDVGANSGRRQNPPTGAFAESGDWDWLCGADRFLWKGARGERTTEWMGADFWDENIYPAGA